MIKLQIRKRKHIFYKKYFEVRGSDPIGPPWTPLDPLGNRLEIYNLLFYRGLIPTRI